METGNSSQLVSANGSVIPPLIIIKGKQPLYMWIKDLKIEQGWAAASLNGWTDNELGLKWLESLRSLNPPPVRSKTLHKQLLAQWDALLCSPLTTPFKC